MTSACLLSPTCRRGWQNRRPTRDRDSADEFSRADDIVHIIDALGGGPVDFFGSSGGPITGIALVVRRPELVRTLVAHEPPLLELLADAAEQRAAIDEIYETYRTQGQPAA